MALNYPVSLDSDNFQVVALSQKKLLAFLGFVLASV